MLGRAEQNRARKKLFTLSNPTKKAWPSVANLDQKKNVREV